MERPGSGKFFDKFSREVGEPVYTCPQIVQMLEYVSNYDAYRTRRNSTISGVVRSATTIKTKADKHNIGIDLSDRMDLPSGTSHYRRLIKKSDIPIMLELLGIHSVPVEEIYGAIEALGFRAFL